MPHRITAFMHSFGIKEGTLGRLYGARRKQGQGNLYGWITGQLTRFMCSLECGYTSMGSKKEHYSGISKVCLPSCTRTMDSACLKQRKTFYRLEVWLSTKPCPVRNLWSGHHVKLLLVSGLGRFIIEPFFCPHIDSVQYKKELEETESRESK